MPGVSRHSSALGPAARAGTHLQAIYTRLNVSSRAAAVSRAFAGGIPGPD